MNEVTCHFIHRPLRSHRRGSQQFNVSDIDRFYISIISNFFRCICVVYLLLIAHRRNHESELLNTFHCFLQRKVLTSLYRILKNY